MSGQSDDFNEHVIDVGPSSVGNSVEAVGPDSEPAAPRGIQPVESFEVESAESTNAVV